MNMTQHYILFTLALLLLAFPVYAETENRDNNDPCYLAKSDLVDLAIAEENYYSHHKTYTMDISKLIGVNTWNGRPIKDLPKKMEFAPSPDVRFTMLVASVYFFIAIAEHKECPRPYIWDSSKGGLQ